MTLDGLGEPVSNWRELSGREVSALIRHWANGNHRVAEELHARKGIRR